MSADAPHATSALATALAEVRAGLSRHQKELPAKYFYDERGSQLFEAITRLPEYYLTRAEREILERRMPEWAPRLRSRALVELGAGSAEKTRLVLDALRDAGTLDVYVPMDVSADFLAASAARLRAEYPRLRVVPAVGDFTGELPLPADLPGPLLVAFLGSTIGNFDARDATALLRRVRHVLHQDDRLLLGADLRKDPAMLEAAYDDAQGVTAEFNRNMLRVVNATVGTDFDPEAYRHRAVYDTQHHRIEMHLVAERPQVVRLPDGSTVRLAKGESIRTEISCKYDRELLDALLAAAELELEEWATDDEGRFALLTARPVARVERA